MSPTRARSWNAAMAASPGPLDLHVAASHITGSVPHSLRGGRVWSNGPGWTHIGGRTAHPFDGHGYVRSFELLPDGGVRLKARFVHTPSYLAEKAAGKLVHRGLATNVSSRFWDNLPFGPRRNVANTTIVRWGGRLLAGWEAGSPYALDPNSLETIGEHDFGGSIAGQATLAHMRTDHQLGRLTLCSVAQGRRTTFTFRELDAQERVVETTLAEVDGTVFAHDYALTPSWFLVGGNPLQVRPGTLVKALVGADTLLHAVAPNLDAPGVLHLIPRGGGGPVRTVQLPEPAFVVHFGNAFERDGTVIVDACVFHAFSFGEEFGYRGPDHPFDPTLPDARGPQRLLRITIPPGADHATWEPLTEHGVDFPRFHPEHEGQQTPVLYGATRRDTRFSDPFDSIIAVDLIDRSRPDPLWTAPEDVFVGEPLLAPGTGPHDRDHVLVILSDGISRASTLAIFEADDLAAGPVTRVPIPHLLPVAFHGDWEGPPSRRSEHQK